MCALILVMLDVRQNAFCLLHEKQKASRCRVSTSKKGRSFLLVVQTLQDSYTAFLYSSGRGGKRGNRKRTEQRGFHRRRGVLNLLASSRPSTREQLCPFGVQICQKNPYSHLDFPLAGSSSSVRSSFKGQR